MGFAPPGPPAGFPSLESLYANQMEANRIRQQQADQIRAAKQQEALFRQMSGYQPQNYITGNTVPPQQPVQQAQAQQQQKIPSAAGAALGVAGQAAGTYAGQQAGGYIGSLFNGAGAAAPVQSLATDGASQAVQSVLPSGVSSFSPAPYGYVTNSAGEAVGTMGAPIGEGISLTGNVIPGAAGLYGFHNLLNQNRVGMGRGVAQGAASGAALGSAIPGVGTAVGAIVGAVIGAARSMIKSGKHDDQYARDAARGYLKKTGLIDGTSSLTLADGSKFNIGVDGGARSEYNFSGGRAPYQINEENPYSQQARKWGEALAGALFATNPKLKGDFTGYFANAAMSNAQSIEGVRANFLQFASKLGLTPDNWGAKLVEAKNAGVFNDEQLAINGHAVNALFMGDPRHYDVRSVAQVKQEQAAAPRPLVPMAAPAPAEATPPPAKKRGSFSMENLYTKGD